MRIAFNLIGLPIVALLLLAQPGTGFHLAFSGFTAFDLLLQLAEEAIKSYGDLSKFNLSWIPLEIFKSFVDSIPMNKGTQAIKLLTLRIRVSRLIKEVKESKNHMDLHRAFPAINLLENAKLDYIYVVPKTLKPSHSERSLMQYNITDTSNEYMQHFNEDIIRDGRMNRPTWVEYSQVSTDYAELGKKTMDLLFLRLNDVNATINSQVLADFGESLEQRMQKICQSLLGVLQHITKEDVSADLLAVANSGVSCGLDGYVSMCTEAISHQLISITRKDFHNLRSRKMLLLPAIGLCMNYHHHHPQDKQSSALY